MTVKNLILSLRTRWPEVRAVLVWIIDSWRRPGSHDARWEQN
jgi:hypothetical protein